MDSATDSVVQAEIAVEVGIRQRIINVLQSRLEYALLLQSTIASNDTTSLSGPGNLRKTTEECMQAIEAPLTPLVYSKPLPKRPALPPPSTQSRAPPTKTPVVKGKFLYVNMPSQDGQMKTFLLRCPTCLKSSFISLQGLLNHGRLVHKEEYATHDSCIAHCAVPFDRALLPSDVISSVEQDGDILTLGTRVGANNKGLGILPGLQRLFEIAVGVDGVSLFPRLEPNAVTNGQESEDGPSTIVSKTLGHHVETPALAPFLGKRARRRGIMTHEEDSVLDIDGVLDQKGVWKKPRRNRGLALEDSVSALCTEERNDSLKDGVMPTPESPLRSNAENTNTTGSRFYNTARVVLTDWSMWLPPERDNPGTYAWMITLDSPSYTTHHTAYISSMTVSSISPTLTPPVIPSTTYTYPFFVRGYTSQPFLARITLGLPEIDGVEQTMVLEHWIDVDPLKAGNPIMGDEQIADLELDRRIVFREPLKSLVRLGDKARFKSFWSSGYPTSQGDDEGNIEPVKMKTEEDWEYEKILRQILPEYPMTLKDSKFGGARPGVRRSVQASRVPKVPYRLLSTPKELLDLVLGRRKAIEWARAKAIYEAYAARTSGQPGALPLSIGDVYRWLEDEGEFPRPIPEPARPTFNDIGMIGEEKNAPALADESKSEGGKPSPPRYCANCGFRISGHSYFHTTGSTKGEQQDGVNSTEQREDLNEHFVCNIHPLIYFKLPMVDIAPIFQFPWTNPTCPGSSTSPVLHWPQLLLKTVDPRLTLACAAIMGREKPTPPDLSQAREDAVDLAPCALLAHTIRPLVRQLVRAALRAADQDKRAMLNTRSDVKPQIGTSLKSPPFVVQLLTTSHVFRGLTEHKGDDTTKRLLLLLSPLGLSSRWGDCSDDEEGSKDGEEGQRTKIQPE